MPNTSPVDIRVQRQSGLKLLSLDAGGPRNVSQLEVLKHVMEKAFSDDGPHSDGLIKPPCEVFDVIGGVGTGGFIAIILVIFKLTAREALEDFLDFSVKVFKDINLDPRKQTSKLEQAVQDIFDKYGVDKGHRLIQDGESTPRCKLIIPITYKSHFGSTCILSNSSSRREPSTNLTIFEAMLASCATSPIFTPITISKDHGTFEYVSGDLGLSNPVREVLAGAHRTFGDEVTVSCLLSIGCGNPGINQAPISQGLDSRAVFLERLAMDSERAAEEISIQMAQLTLYHRISVKYGLEMDVSSVWRDLRDIVTQTSTYLNDLEVEETVGRCIDSLKEESGFSTLEQLRHSGGAKVIATPLVPLTPNYVEREIPTKFLEDALFEAEGIMKRGSKIVAVTGIGGCGKTQLIRRFLEKYQSLFASMCFVDGSNKDSIKHGIVRHVRSFGSNHSQDSFEDAMRFLSLPTSGSERLLIIDNVDDPSLDLSSFLPRWSNGAVLVTSRNQSRGQLSPNSHLQLDVMSLDESVQLIIHGLGRTLPLSESDRFGAVTVAEELGCLPIALVQAVSYIFNTGCTEAMYITRLRKNRARVLQNPATNQLDMRYKTAFAAFDASYELLLPRAQKALHLLSFFHQQGFPVELIEVAGEEDFSTQQPHHLDPGDAFERGRDCLKEIFYSFDEWDPTELDLIVASLRNNSLAAMVLSEGMRLLHMHPLVHEWGRLRIPKADIGRFKDAAIRLLSCGATESNYLMMQHLHVHVRALSLIWEELHANDAASFAFILHESGIYFDALKLYKSNYNKVLEHLGANDLRTIYASETLAATYYRLGRYVETEQLHPEILRQRQIILGLDHPDTIRASSNLASTYAHLGREAEAERLVVEVFKKREKLQGADHPDTIRAFKEVGSIYAYTGRHVEAERIQVEVLKQLTKLRGVDHPDTVDASAHLAETYSQQGKYAEAEKLYVEVLKQRKRLQGVDHPDTINDAGELAVMYREIGRYAEAERLQVDAMERSITSLGTDHPETISAFADLALIYYKMGRHAEAAKLEMDVLKQRVKLLGLDHPDTIVAATNLAITYEDMGKYRQAEWLRVNVLTQSIRLLGTDHPDTIHAVRNLAVTYGHMDRYAEEEKLEMMVLKHRKRILGSDHPSTIDAAAKLAATYNSLGKDTKAEKLEIKVLKKRERLLGAEHPDTIQAAKNLAFTYNALGRPYEMARLELMVLERLVNSLGTDNKDTIDAAVALASTCSKLGRSAEAERLLTEILKQRTKILGESHADTIETSEKLATLYYSLERYAEAERLETKVVQQRTKLLGERHQDTLKAMLSLAFTYEALHRLAEAVELAKQAHGIALETLGSTHSLSRDLFEFLELEIHEEEL